MDVLGLDEFMWWCNNMNMMVMLAIWAGKSYGSIVSGDQLQPYVETLFGLTIIQLFQSNLSFDPLRLLTKTAIVFITECTGEREVGQKSCQVKLSCNLAERG